jgi:hypothetical protein
MIAVPLRDGTFRDPSLTLSGENAGKGPAHFQWDRKPPETALSGPLAVFTDMTLDEVRDSQAERNVALLIEPSAFSKTHYEKAIMLAEQFCAILTFESEYAMLDHQWRFYPLGGSWISEWDIFEKLRRVSIIISDKWVTEGHRLRQQIVREFMPDYKELYVFGEPHSERFESKAQPLRHFAYSIVVESTKTDWYFTEKIIDCFSQGTVPIYWGCPSIGEFFDMGGIIPFSSMEQLRQIMGQINSDDWLDRRPAIKRNMEAAKRYVCAEDNIWAMYPDLFGGE